MPNLAAHTRTQIARFVRLFVVAFVTTLVAQIEAFHGQLTKTALISVLAGAIVAAAETTWRQVRPALPVSVQALIASPAVAAEAQKIESAVVGATHPGPLVVVHAAPPVAAAAVASPAPVAVAPEVTPPATPAPATPLPAPTAATVTNVPPTAPGAAPLDVGQIAPVDAPAVQAPPAAPAQ